MVTCLDVHLGPDLPCADPVTEYIVPMGTPQFFLGNTPATDPAYVWAGAYPYIDTADFGGSYGEARTSYYTDFREPAVGSILPAYTAPVGVTVARADIQINMPTPGSHSGIAVRWELFCDDVTAPYNWGVNGFPGVVAGWNTFADTRIFEPDWRTSADIPAMLAALATGRMRFTVRQQATVGQTDFTFQVSQLRLTLITPDIPPLRQVQREDGLGRSVMRARSTHSVQKSIRQRGYV